MSSKEQENLSEGRKEQLRGMLVEYENLLSDYIEEIPQGIISAGRVLVNGKIIILSRPTVYKCQTNWFQSVVNAVGRILREFPSDELLVDRCKAYETSIISRQKIPLAENPQLFVDDFGRPHILTMKEDIDEANKILKIIIRKLESIS